MTSVLTSKLAAVRRKQAMVCLGTGSALIAGAVVLLLAAGMMIDWWWNLPRPVRLVIFAIDLLAVAGIGIWFIVIPIIYGSDEESLALEVEREERSLSGRLIAAVQLSREGAVPAGASAAMVSALVSQTEEMAEPMDFSRAVKTDGLLRLFGISALILLLGLIGFAYAQPASGQLLKRALGADIPVPRKTNVESMSGDMIVARGDPTSLRAIARGVIPSSGGLVTMEFESGTTQQFAIDPDPGAAGQFVRNIDNVQDSFTYRIALGDGESESKKVTAILRPAVSQLQCQQIFPSYTKLSAIKRLPGDLALLEGSRLVIGVTANKKVKYTSPSDPKGNRVHLIGSNVDFPLEADINDTSKLIARDGASANIPLPKGTTGFTIHLIDEYGLESKEPAVYRVDLLPDKPPTVRLTSPDRKEELVTSIATINLGFDAADDFALGKLAIKYKLTRGDAKPQAAVGSGNGLAAEYFTNRDLAGAALKRVDQTVDFDWGGGGPDSSMTPENFSARWTGQVQPAFSEDYTFYTFTDDGVRLWVDGKLIIDNWRDHQPTEDIATVSLKGGQKYDIKLEYFEGGGNATCRLSWSSDNTEKQPVPQDRLYSPDAPGKGAIDARTRDAMIAAGEKLALENLVGRWKFDEKSGKRANDTSKNQNPALLKNVAFSPGRLNNAGSFDGVESQAMIANIDPLNPVEQITVAAWTNALDWPGYRRIVQKGMGDNQYRLLSEDRRLKFELAGVGAVFAPLPSTLVWHHVAGTYDGDTMKLFVDGVVVGTSPDHKGGKINRTDDPVYIGTKHDTAQPIERFSGLIDDVRIYNRALTENEIKTLAVPMAVAAPVEGPATTVVDASKVQTIELDLGGQTPKSLRRRYDLKLATLSPMPTEGVTLEYWVEARDTNDATGPGIGTSEHYIAHVVSEATKRAELMNRLGDYLGQIKDVAQTQEELNAKLGELIQAKPGGQ